MTENNFSVVECFQDKTVLVIGGNGFLGKVWGSLILEHVPGVRKLIVLMRPKENETAKERFKKSYEISPVFKNLREKFGPTFDKCEKIQVLSGDVTKENLGIESDSLSRTFEKVDIVLNFAADLRFAGPLDEMLLANVQSVLYLCDVLRSFKKIQLLHVSTCYVAGSRDGVVPEKVFVGVSPNETKFDVLEEFHAAMEEGLTLQRRNASKEEKREVGEQRAQKLGWPNTYTYSKSLAEMVLTQQLPKERFTIFRPSIVESSLSFPFPGWNEDFNGTAPILNLLQTRYRYLLARPEYSLDVVPVDIVAKSITAVSARLLTGQHNAVYHCSTSDSNPITVKNAADMATEYYDKIEKKPFAKRVIPKISPQFVGPEHLMSLRGVKRFEKTMNSMYAGMSSVKAIEALTERTGMRKLVQKFSKRARGIEIIMKMYRPFVYDYNYTFQTGHLRSLRPVEDEFQFEPQKIHWKEYWHKVHVPALKQWCFPKLSPKK